MGTVTPQIGVAASALLSIMMLAAIALAWGGWRMYSKHGDKRKGVLMWICAVILLANVAIWTI
ncbi:hypothetical protein P1X14_13260 [Sphingomonas sp. AOB5]|uniref:hypothetical protein n=1 Tax=Sphingomonas sp. AOB5 TaxID=3034017 RepID=UPI0023F6A940|nr:hypothetical protein [Sphingomonas sp. AOB5]MDF7776221.1 hypothetical protein [Sphingomonas sp. AOB5]